MKKLWLIVGREVRMAYGHYRGNGSAMVPTEHGPLYFNRGLWYETKAEADLHIASKGKK